MSTSRATGGAVEYDEWTEQLFNHFFGPDLDGLPVMFFVDDEAVATIYGGSRADAVTSLVTAVHERLQMRKPSRLFRDIEIETRQWRDDGGEGPPPSLPVLALSVLAATRMGRRRDRASTNYYKPFCELLSLEVDQQRIEESYRDAMPYMWHSLQWLLDDKHRGRLGFSTIVEDSFFTYIGYADSQTLFSSSDGDKLTQFFRWIGLEPGEQIDQGELMTYFRAWASRRDDLSEGAEHMLATDEYGAQLARIIKTSADRWHGGVRNQGRREAEIVITLELFPRRRLALAAERPEDFPAELNCHGPTSDLVALSSSHDGWYDELPLPASSAVLSAGLLLTSSERRLRFQPHSIHVLEKNAELGRWASVSQISPGEPAWLLVQANMIPTISTYLEQNARPGWNHVQRANIAPPGWSLVGEVTVDAADESDAPQGLARIIPRVKNRFSFKGGLPLPRGSATYLTGGEPDLWLPPSPAAGSVEVEIDSDQIVLAPSTTHVRIAGRDLHEGSHLASIAGVARAFATIRTLGHTSPHADKTIAHSVKRGDMGFESVHAGPRIVDDGLPRSEIRIFGPFIEGTDDDIEADLVAPLILPTRAKYRVVLGARPGEIAHVPAPKRPPWMNRADLEFQVFEYMPLFPAVWIITTWNLEPKTRVRLKQALQPGQTPDGASPSDIEAWSAALIETPGPDNDTSGLWSSFSARAAELRLQ